MSPENNAVEAAIRALFDTPNVVVTSRAALGLSAVLRAWHSSDRPALVAMPSAVCHDVLVAVLDAGCSPYFCDVDPASGLVPTSEWIRARAAGASVAVVVHLYGNCADTSDVCSVFAGQRCLVIDDAAQALGSRLHGRLVGNRGDVGLLSFGPTKQISVGGAALTIRDSSLAKAVRDRLGSDLAAPEDVRANLVRDFRERLERARERLRLAGRPAASDFQGIASDLRPTLHVPFATDRDSVLPDALRRYPAVAERRVEMAMAWSKAIEDTLLEPVGMGPGVVPWRFVCRLPGIDWRVQHELGTKMRASGMRVSHWYLPAHWIGGRAADILPGVEQLSAEVFQFWVDESVSPQSARRESDIVKRVVAGHSPYRI